MKLTDKNPCVVKGETLNELVWKSCYFLDVYGDWRDSRNGKALEVIDVSLILNNPDHRHMYLKGRKNNLFSTLAETFWVLAGHCTIHPFLEYFVPRAKNYSDDGRTWHDAYGPRLYAFGQLEHVLDAFSQEGSMTRRAVIGLWDSATDTFHARRRAGVEEPKALPCNNFIWYWIRENKLYCKVAQRSADLVWGISNINIFEFSLLQEIVLVMLKQQSESFNELELGTYTHNAISLHAYESTYPQVKEMMEVSNQKTNGVRSCKEDTWKVQLMPLATPKTVREFFHGVVKSLGTITNWKVSGKSVEKVFDQYNVPKSGNILYAYVVLVSQYIAHQEQVRQVMIPDSKIRDLLPLDLRAAVRFNKFTPWR